MVIKFLYRGKKIRKRYIWSNFVSEPCENFTQTKKIDISYITLSHFIIKVF